MLGIKLMLYFSCVECSNRKQNKQKTMLPQLVLVVSFTVLIRLESVYPVLLQSQQCARSNKYQIQNIRYDI